MYTKVKHAWLFKAYLKVHVYTNYEQNVQNKKKNRNMIREQNLRDSSDAIKKL